MKAVIVIFALFALAACDYHHTYAEYLDMYDFIQGTWYYNSTSTQADFSGCCVPTGAITISNDTTNSSQMLLNSTIWSGSLCGDLNLTNGSAMILPFAGNSTYYNLTQATTTYNAQGVDIDFGALTVGNYTPSNDSDLLTVSIDFNFNHITTNKTTDWCWINIQKSASIAKVTGAMFVALVAFFAF